MVNREHSRSTARTGVYALGPVYVCDCKLSLSSGGREIVGDLLSFSRAKKPPTEETAGDKAAGTAGCDIFTKCLAPRGRKSRPQKKLRAIRLPELPAVGP